jgi:hypothetical protein
MIITQETLKLVKIAKIAIQNFKNSSSLGKVGHIFLLKIKGV